VRGRLIIDIIYIIYITNSISLLQTVGIYSIFYAILLSQMLDRFQIYYPELE